MRAMPNRIVAVLVTAVLAWSLANPIAAIADGDERLWGQTRYETSVAVSQRFDPRPAVAFVATGTDYPDALAGAAAAAATGGPLLLTSRTHLPAVVRMELQRLKPKKIIVLGLAGAISDDVVKSLSALAPTERVGGADRYATSQRLIDRVFSSTRSVAIATGRGYADALVTGAAAGGAGAPLLLIDGGRTVVPTGTIAALRRWGVEEIAIAGGHGAVDIHIEQQLRTAGFAVTRHAGPTRFETAVAVNAAYYSAATPDAVFLSTGLDFPDALSASALAGHRHAPLYLTRKTCVPKAAHDAITDLDADLITVGGVGAVSAAAAANTACPGSAPRIPKWATTGWELSSDIVPYDDRTPVDVHDRSITLDATGLRIYERRDNGVRADHPVAYAQYGISALMEYQRTGTKLWLDRALRHGERLTQMRTERDGAWWFPYLFPWTYYERTLTVPWWSGMAQGEALSLFVRLHEETGDARWWTAAEQTWASFLQPPVAGSPWSTMVDRGRLFFEEYAGNQPPLLVLNGQVFAAFGVYDYWQATGDPRARAYVDGAATTVLKIMPLIRKPGGVSYYCAQEPYCQSSRWQNANYHAIHSWQLDTLARLTGDTAFTKWADLLRSDWQRSARFAQPPTLGWEDGPPQ
ncbi:cell wall-binding repeat-containing protein [Microbacterium invictum]|uniref:Cell wall-binding protein n=1 Tax=Microbacterium invictum TaxID=515415 RepID=A0AA40SP06_9MICO|nr:cell wall-binding repeat-containing protein [Microbacterium invictum]MBB4139762.1 putative cell wall-binding protein [Microbacterium invictum]